MWKSFIKSKSNKFNLPYIKPHVLFWMHCMTYMEVVLDCWRLGVGQFHCVTNHDVWVLLFGLICFAALIHLTSFEMRLMSIICGCNIGLSIVCWSKIDTLNHHDHTSSLNPFSWITRLRFHCCQHNLDTKQKPQDYFVLECFISYVKWAGWKRYLCKTHLP